MMIPDCLRTLTFALGLLGAAAPATPPQPGSTLPIEQRLRQAEAALFSGTTNVETLVRELKAILAIDPRVAEGHMYLGMAYRMLGSEELIGEAKAELVQALSLKPELVPARFILAQLYLDLGRAATARETLNAGLAQHPGQPQLTSLLGEAERQLGNPLRAVELTRAVLLADDSFAQARFYLALALLELGQRDDAIVELERVVRSGAKVAEAFLALGTAYVDAGRVDAGLETLRQAAAVDPPRADTRIALARVYRLRGALAKAETELALAKPRAVASGAAPLAGQQVEADYYLELGLLRKAQGRFDAAVAAFQKVLDTEPDHGAAASHLLEVRTLRDSNRGKAKPGGRS